MTPSSSDCCCSKQATPEQVIQERSRDSMTEFFTEYRQRVGQGVRQAVELARKRSHQFLVQSSSNCTSGNQVRQSFWKRLNFDEVATGILVLLILLMLSLGLYLVRSYNRACAYGSGGCLWPMFWGQCQIMT